MSEVTQILERLPRDDPKATEELLPLVYEELRRLARSKMAGESPDHTLQATALVHEAYLRLVGGEDRQWDHRGHFFAGLELAEAAAVLGISERTADRYWAWARSWLYREIQRLNSDG